MDDENSMQELITRISLSKGGRGQRLSTGTSSKKGMSEMIKHMKRWLHYVSYLKMATSVIWVNKRNNIARNNYCKQDRHVDSIYNY